MSLTLELPAPTIVGTQVTVKMTFRNPGSSSPVDPEVVTLAHQDGDGATTTWTYGTDVQLVRRGQGRYEAEIMLINAGTWSVKAKGVGGCDIVGETSFPVENPSF